jgi:hypothetical protein|uniref:Uncharacterized protein n=1 Tax=Zea mays TaxID=4577 RepID=C4J791_MAIZE|nr:unknown [Zea mays]
MVGSYTRSQTRNNMCTCQIDTSQLFSTRSQKEKRLEMRHKIKKSTVLDDTRKMSVLTITLLLVPDPTCLNPFMRGVVISSS